MLRVLSLRRGSQLAAKPQAQLAAAAHAAAGRPRSALIERSLQHSVKSPLLSTLQTALLRRDADAAEAAAATLRRSGVELSGNVREQLMLLLAASGAKAAVVAMYADMLAAGNTVTPEVMAALLVAESRSGAQAYAAVAARIRSANIDPKALLQQALDKPHLAKLIHKHVKDLAVAAPEVVPPPPSRLKFDSPTFREQWKRESQLSIQLGTMSALAAQRAMSQSQKAAAPSSITATTSPFTSSTSTSTSSSSSSSGGIEAVNPVFHFKCWMPSVTKAVAEYRVAFNHKWDRELNKTPGSLLAVRARNLRRKDEFQTLLFSGFLTDEEIARIVLSTMENQLVNNRTGGATIRISEMVGQNIFRALFVAHQQRSGLSELLGYVYPKYLSLLNNADLWRSQSPAACWQNFVQEYHSLHPDRALQSDTLRPWPRPIVLACGAELVSLVMDTALAKEMTGNARHVMPAFLYKVTFDVFQRAQGVIQLVDFLNEYTKSECMKAKNVYRKSYDFDTSKLPMLVPPRPWLAVAEGGPLVSPVALARTHMGQFGQLELLSTSQFNLRPMLDALTSISSVAWRINNKVLDVVNELFLSRKPYEHLGLVGEKVTFKDFAQLPFNAALDKASLEEAFRKQQSENYGERCSLDYKLTTANWLRDKPFWVPHNVDFRGRAYPLSANLSHMGDDAARSLFMFDEGKPLGKDGLRWLKIHLANVYGKDKLSLANRVKFVDDNMHHIRSTVANPLAGADKEGNAWWTRSDKPFQVLASCYELVAALDSGDPSAYISHLPVHQDGTCNGLQHYAALGGDVEGAKQVNVIPTEGADVPQDVYTAVARRMDAIIAQHAAGNYDAFPRKKVEKLKNFEQLARSIQASGPLPRKIVKQTVMTTVYGVTFVGGREQIKGQLADHKLFANSDSELFQASTYLALLVFLSLGDIFKRASLIQKWLSDNAGRIASTGAPVVWHTPLGFVAVQPYSDYIGANVRTRSFELRLDEGTNRPDSRRQRSAFPPNYVHSLDASHMLYTAQHCKAAGVTFAAVHDSFWTHAGTVEQLGRITREQFLHLHSQPLLQNLYESFKIHYEGRKLRKGGSLVIPPPPERGPLDLSQVLKSPFFFS